MSSGARFWALLALTACGGAELSGATAVPVEFEPAERSGTRLVATACRDGSGAPAHTAVQLRFVQSTDGRQLLYARRPGYDSVIVQQRRELPDAVLFEFLAKPSSGRELRHVFRFPRGAGPSELTVTDLALCDQAEHGVVLVCRLDTERP